MTRHHSRSPRLADLLADLVDGTDRMLLLHRAALLNGTDSVVELPKLLLEMVRCLVTARRLDPRDESPYRAAAHDGLWRDLVAIEQLAPGAALDQRLRQLPRSWLEFAAVTAEEVSRARRHPSDTEGPDWPTTTGGAMHGCHRTHPTAVQPLLRHETPCPGLVETAARAFAFTPP
jgi:hypothetical protein